MYDARIMPSPKKIDRAWRPSAEQIAAVARMFDEGYDPAYVRQRIVDPNTGDPVSVGLFRRAFHKQLEVRAKRQATMDAFQPTPGDRARVKAAVLMGYPMEMIARTVVNPLTAGPISVNMLKRHFRDELDLGEMLNTVAIAGRLVRQARAGDMRAAVYYLDNMAKKRQAAEGVKTGLIIVPADMPEEAWTAQAAENQDRLLSQERNAT